MSARDLIGYGANPPAFVWPNGARVAVSIVVNFEEGAELAVGDGDAENERIGEVLSSVTGRTRDFGQEQIFAYGMRVGLWRFLDAFDRYGFRTTFFMCGRAIERLPDHAAEVVRRGHEPACHGWLWRPHSDFTDKGLERDALTRCIEVTQKVTGERPYGFYCRSSQSVWTRDLLLDLGFVYDSNGYDDELPYHSPVGDRRILVLPYALDCNDMKFFHPNGFVEAEQFVRYAKSSLGTLLAEAERGRSSMLNIGLHLRIGGRPGRFAAIEGILAHLQSLGPQIWVARRIDIAKAWLAQVPPSLS